MGERKGDLGYFLGDHFAGRFGRSSWPEMALPAAVSGGGLTPSLAIGGGRVSTINLGERGPNFAASDGQQPPHSMGDGGFQVGSRGSLKQGGTPQGHGIVMGEVVQEIGTNSSTLGNLHVHGGRGDILRLHYLTRLL